MLALNRTSKNKIINKCFSDRFVIFLSIFYRIIILFLVRGDNFFKLKINNYTSMLDENFSSFINFEHTKPLVFFYKDFLAYKIYPYNYSFVNFILICVLDLIAVLIYYKLIVEITNSRKLASLFSILLSFSFVTWEYWREASHYDHLNIFIFAVCIHASFCLFKTKKLRNVIYYVISLSLIICFNSFGLVFTFISVFLTLGIKNKKNIFLALLLFISLYLAVISGNLQKFNMPLISSVKGPNQLSFIWSNKSVEKTINEQLNNSTIFPQWYKECFFEANKKLGRTGSIYGLCFPNPYLEPDSAKKYFKKILSTSDDSNLNSYIKSDLKLIDQPYHFSGGVNEIKLNFSVYYGRYTQILARKVAFKKPFLTLYSFAKSFYMGLSGVRFFTGLHYEPQLINLPSFHKKFNYLISFTFVLGVITSIVKILIFIKNMIFRNKFFRSLEFENISKSQKDYLINFSTIYIFTTFFAFSASTCCENGRMMVGILPYSLLLFLYFAKSLYSKSNKFNYIKSLFAKSE